MKTPLIIHLSNEEILRFRDELKLSINEGFVNEAYTSEFFTKIKAKFRRWFTDIQESKRYTKLKFLEKFKNKY